MNKTKEYYELDFPQLLHALWQRLWAIILSAVIFAGIAFSCAVFFVTPKYEAEVLMYVNNSSFSLGSANFSISTSELSAAQSLVDTYIVILNTRTTLNDVIETANLDYTYKELKDMLRAEPVNSTEVFSITVTSENPREAELIANTIAHVLPDTISDVVDGSDVRIVDHAVFPSSQVSPNVTVYTAIGLLIGIAVACLIIIVQAMTDTLIHNEDYLLDTYNLPVLTVIPNLTNNKSSGYYSAYRSKSKAEVNGNGK